MNILEPFHPTTEIRIMNAQLYTTQNVVAMMLYPSFWANLATMCEGSDLLKNLPQDQAYGMAFLSHYILVCSGESNSYGIHDFIYFEETPTGGLLSNLKALKDAGRAMSTHPNKLSIKMPGVVGPLDALGLIRVVMAHFVPESRLTILNR